MIDPHQFEDLYLYAVNTGELYATHLRLAGLGVNDGWLRYVYSTLIPSYRREFGPLTVNRATRIALATRLAEYYAEHIKESQS